MEILAQNRSASPAILIWSAGLLLLVAIGFALVMWLRKQMSSTGSAGMRGSGFTLADLRALHKQGMMTDEEFERAKAQIVKQGVQQQSHPSPQNQQAGQYRPRGQT